MKILIYFSLIHLLLLIPGFVAVKKIKIFRSNIPLQVALGYALSISTFALLMLAAYAFSFSYDLIRMVSWIILISSIILFVKNKYWQDLIKARLPLFGVLVLSSLSTLFVLLPMTKVSNIIPDPEYTQQRNYGALNVKVLNISQTNANDNYIPYRQAQFIINQSNPATDSFIDEWGVHFFQRTPLMGGVTAFFFNLLDDKPPVDYTWSSQAQDPDLTYIKFQLIAHILNAVFIVPAYVLIRHFFNRKVAGITVMFLSVSQFFIYNSIFSWPKSLTAFFILLSWVALFATNRKYALLGGVLGGIAYLTHDLAVLFIGASVIMLLSQKRFRDILYVGVSTILIMLPWLITSSVIFKKPSSFIYYPFSIHGIPQPDQKTEIIREFFRTSPFAILWIKIESLFYLVSPYQLIVDEGGQTATRRLWALGLFSLPGSIGLGLVGFSVIGLFKKFKSKLLLLGLAFLPLVLCVLVIGWPRGLGILHFAQPTVVLLSAFGVFALTTLSRGRLWATLAYILCCVHLLYFVLYSYGFQSISSWATTPKTFAIMVLITSILVISGISVHRLVKSGDSTDPIAA